MNSAVHATLAPQTQPQMIEVAGRCRLCREPFDVIVSLDSWHAWRTGTLIQNAIPELSKETRELLITGVCADCWRLLEEPN